MRSWTRGAEIEESLHRAGGLCICALSCVERLSDILAGFAAEVAGNADFRIGSTPEGSDLLLDSAVSRDEVPAGAEVLFDEEICIAGPGRASLCGLRRGLADRACGSTRLSR